MQTKRIRDQLARFYKENKALHKPEKTQFKLDLGDYVPNKKQLLLHQCPANEILYGGASGGGKSKALRMEALIWASRISGLQVYLFRRTYPELEKNHILYARGEYPNFVVWNEQNKRFELPNGSMIHMCYAQYEKDVFNYQGAEIHLLLIDEATTFTEFMYDYLRARVRCPMPIPEQYKCRIPGIILASNPGGVGHNFIKRRWVDFVKPGKIKVAPRAEGGMMRAFIPAKLEDNPILMKYDPDYESRLDALPEPYRTAYRNGDWNIFMGQAFDLRSEHIIEPVKIPQYAPIYMCMDWGYGAPFAILWSWIDADNRIYVFHEWYGWNGEENVGLRLTDSQIAEGIIERERQLGIQDKKIIRLAGPDCWNKKPDYRGGGQGPSTAEVFARYGLYLQPGDPNRQLKIRQFRERLRIPKDGSLPMLVVYETCRQFIRTIQSLQVHPNDPEYIDDRGEDHFFDAICHLCMARPLSLVPPPRKKTEAERRIEVLIKGSMPKDEEYIYYQALEDEIYHQQRAIHEFYEGGSYDYY